MPMFPTNPLLVVVPACHARKSRPLIALVDHVVFGGVLREAFW